MKRRRGGGACFRKGLKLSLPLKDTWLLVESWRVGRMDLPGRMPPVESRGPGLMGASEGRP